LQDERFADACFMRMRRNFADPNFGQHAASGTRHRFHFRGRKRETKSHQTASENTKRAAIFGGCLLETGIIPRDQVTSRGVMIDAQAGLPVTRRRGRSKEAVAGDAAVL
jgi:hypothetical protein